jgi:hypothetical protein
MMDRMIYNMSVEEKEEMMLKMMPIMMEDVDINEMMPDMLAEIGRLLTVTGIVVFISTALNDEELKGEVSELLVTVKEKLPELADTVQDKMPAMMSLMTETGLMDGLLDTMGKLMPFAMPMMREMAPIMMKDKMPDMMEKHDSVRQLMPEMMMDIIPDCVEMLPNYTDPQEQSEFLDELAEKMERAESFEVKSN